MHRLEYLANQIDSDDSLTMTEEFIMETPKNDHVYIQNPDLYKKSYEIK